MLMLPPETKQIISSNASRIGGSQPQWDVSASVDSHALGGEELGAHGHRQSISSSLMCATLSHA
jgi:hypothetical protein